MRASLVTHVVKNPPANAGDTGYAGSIPELGRFPEKEMAFTPVFLPGKSHGESSLMTMVPGVEKSGTLLSD